MTKSTMLSKINQGWQALASAETLDDVLAVRDAAVAVYEWLRSRNPNHKECVEAMDLKLSAERRAGEFLHTQGPKQGKPPKGDNMSHLNELGITRKESSRWQQMAVLSDDDYHRLVDEARESFPDIKLTQSKVLQAARRGAPEAVANAIALPAGQYHTIVADPPWPMKKIERDVAPNQGDHLEYPTMTLQEINDMSNNVQALIPETGAHLYLWVTQKYLPAGLDIMRAWGFKYQCVLTWVKNVGFTPFSWMYSTEHVLFGRAGGLDLLKMGKRLDFSAKTTGHSIKPDVFYNLVREVSPGPRLEMFARKAHEGFEPWGAEAQ